MDSNLPYSEQFRLAAELWADREAAASLLEESKSAMLARRMSDLGDIPINKAERIVKSSQAWTDYIAQMCADRAAANKARVQCEYLKMKFWEHNSHEASRRSEMRFG